MSFHEIAIAVRAENRASGAFRSVALDVANLGAAFGLLSNEQVKAVSIFFTVIRVAESLKVILGSVTVAQWAHTVATQASAVAQAILNMNFVTFLALTGVGIAVIIAAAAAMWYFAEQTKAAAASVSELGVATGGLGRERGIRRAGEEEYYRRGVEY